jgi:NAD(P)-dependent dehydrogenase (short-subunit alcohol dehydrogenase family)
MVPTRKTTLVTGASPGMDRTTALALAAAGARALRPQRR